MSFFLVNLLLALLWASLQEFRPVDFMGGFLIGYGLIWVARSGLGEEAVRYNKRVPNLVRFVIYYFGEVLASTWDVIRAEFRDPSSLKPGIIAYPLETRNDFEIVLLNNLLALTPGTLGVDLSPDRRILYIHIIDVPDPDIARQKIKDGLERRLMEVIR
jgi:multicomponent Na+:H+ antiporter subunit E